MSIIWLTRGKAWDYRFIHSGGYSDPLPTFEGVLSHGIESGETLTRHGSHLGLVFLDPLERRDQSGRPILHGFVIEGELAEKISSLQDGIREVWPLVAEEYERIWELPKPPTMSK